MRKYQYVLFVVVALCFLISGCAKDNYKVVEEITNVVSDVETVSMRDTVLYYLDENDYMIPVQTKIAWEEGIGKAALSELIVGGDDEIKLNSLGLFSPVPDGVTFDLDIEDGTARVDIILNGNELPKGKKKKMMYHCISNTLMCFESVEKVIFYVDGKSIKTSSEEDISDEYISTMANVEPQGASDNVPEKYAHLYFVSSSGKYLVPVERLLSDMDAQAVVDELLIPNTNTSLSSAISPSIEILGVGVDGNVATIDVSRDFKQLLDNPEQERLTLSALRYSLTAMDDIEAVLITIEGKLYEPVLPTMSTSSFYNILD